MKKLILVAILFCSLSAFTQDSTYMLTVTPIPISIDIADVEINGTILKRKATLFTMTYNQSAKYLVLNWSVSFFADSLGFYGRSLSEIIPSYSHESIADNNTFVNPATGQILIADSTGHYSINYMGQYDWFNMMAETQPLQIHDMIRQYGMLVTNWEK